MEDEKLNKIVSSVVIPLWANFLMLAALLIWTILTTQL